MSSHWFLRADGFISRRTSNHDPTRKIARRLAAAETLSRLSKLVRQMDVDDLADMEIKFGALEVEGHTYSMHTMVSFPGPERPAMPDVPEDCGEPHPPRTRVD